MSTKTSIKRIALVAVAALGFGMLTNVAANAAVAIDSTSSAVSQTIASGQSVTTTITMDSAGGPNDYTAVSFASTGTSTATAAWSLTNLVDSKVTVGSLSGTEAAGFTLAVKNASTTGATANLTISVSGSAGAAITVTGFKASIGGAALPLVLTVGGTSVSTTDTPFQVISGDNTGVTGDVDTAGAALAVTKQVASSTDITKVKAMANTAALSGAGNYRYVEVTGSTINAVTGGWVLNGSANSATQAAAPQSGIITGSQIWLNTGTAGATVTLKFYEKLTDSITGFVTTKLYQTITITTAAYAGLNAALSTALMCSNGSGAPINSALAAATSGTYPKTGCGFLGTTDDTVLAKAALSAVGGVTSGITTAKAVIKVSLNSMTSTGTATPLLGTLPAVAVKIDGPGTLSIGTTPNADASTGRYLTAAAAPANVFYINVFSDGTSGVGTISILVGGSVWKTKTVNFYGTATKLVASSGFKVLQAGSTYAVPSTACALAVPVTCGTTRALTPAVQVLATDANGIAVPGLTYTGTADGTVVLKADSSSNSGDAVADSIGATWFGLITSPNAVSGNTGTASYKTTLADGTVLTSNTVSWAIGGAISTMTMALGSDSSTEVGAKNSLVFTAKDAAGNAAYDQDVTATLTSNVALVSGGSAATSGLPNGNVFFVGGSSTAHFFNPQTAQDVTISGTVSKAVTLTFSVVNSATNAAVDAANEATDAANAATDAANAAAEAADAATAAAQDAQAAVAALATQVASLIAGIKAQITSLTNLIIKIKKKVRA